MNTETYIPVQKVMHIYRYLNRFELPSGSLHCQTAGLQFVRLFCDGSADMEAMAHNSQLGGLAVHENRYEMEGIYWHLVKLASRPDRGHRGYLLDPDLRPLSDQDLVRELHLPILKIRQTLRALYDVGLIEDVPVNMWDQCLNGVSRPAGASNRQATAERSQTGGPGDGVSAEGHSGENSAGQETDPDIKKAPNGDDGQSFANCCEKNHHVDQSLSNGNGNGKRKTGRVISDPSLPPRGNPLGGEPKTGTGTETGEATGGACATGSPTKRPSHPTHGKLKFDSDNRDPTLSEPWGTANAARIDRDSWPSPGSAFSRPECAQAFAGQVFDSLGLTYRLDSDIGRQNMGTFASIYNQIVQCPGYPALIERSLKRAREIAAAVARGSITPKRSKEALWTYETRKRIQAQKVTR